MSFASRKDKFYLSTNICLEFTWSSTRNFFSLVQYGAKNRTLMNTYSINGCMKINKKNARFSC